MIETPIPQEPRRHLFAAATLVPCLLPVLALFVGWLGFREAEHHSQRELAAQLESEVKTSAQALRFWIEDQRAIARSWASESGARQQIVAIVDKLAVRERRRDEVLTSGSLGELRTLLRPVCESHGFIGFVVLDLRGEVLAALFDEAIGQTVEPPNHDWQFHARQKQPVFVPPSLATLDLPDADGKLAPNRSTMFVAAPVANDAGDVVAMLAFRLRPEGTFADALKSGRPGESGETYAFDARGVMLSDSRFENELRRIGLLPDEPTSHAALTLALRDPGGNVMQGHPLPAARDSLPLTKMATSAIAGKDGVDVEGYRDYRGVPVVGAWRWMSEYGFGVAHEIDRDEVYASLQQIDRVFLIWLALTTAALLASLVLHIGWRRAEGNRSVTQAAMASLANRFQQVLDSATQVSIIATDTNGLITVFNSGAERMLGYRAEEMIGKQTPMIIHVEAEVREHGEQLSRQFGRTIGGFGVFIEYARQGSFEEREWTYVRKDGSPLTVNLVVTAQTDAAGQITGYLGIARDITASKRIEERFRLAVETSLTALIMVDEQRRIVLVNSQAEKEFGYRREELLGQRIEMLVPFSLRERHPALVAEFFANPRARHMAPNAALHAVRKDGTTFDVEIGLNPLTSDEGPMVLCAVIDVTERMAVQRALREAKEAAEAANRAKSNFLANMSHEIRTPMHAVMGMTELVLDTELSPVQRDYLTSVAESADGLMSILNEILDFSKIEAGQVTLEDVPFALRETLGDGLKSLAYRAASKGLELAWRVASDVPEGLKGDPTRLRQIIVNLVGNAIKFTPRGEVVVGVELGPDPGHLHFAVQDTGVGIPTGKLKKIFEPFTQADMSTTREFGGTGLGLSICQTLVRLMGGRIWVESQFDVGSTFHFTIPYHEANAAEMSQVANLGEPLALDAASLLVVDDNATNRLILYETLAPWGLRVQTAERGADALRLLKEAQRRGDPVQVVLTDLHMPEMDGFQLVEALRGDPELASLSVVLLTSGFHRGDTQRCEDLGIVAHLTKPVKPSELRLTLSRLIGRPTLSGPPPAAKNDAMNSFRSPRLRILIAEDLLMNQKLAVGLLTRWGHATDVAVNGREVLRKLKTNTYDLILMDVSMPELDGLETTREIRRLEQESGGHLPIVAMTAHAYASDREACEEAGMDGFITKPLRRRELAATLSRLFANHSVPPTAESAQTPITIAWDHVLQGLEGDRDLLLSVLEACLEEVPRLNDRLEKAVAARDNQATSRAAHAIKGALRILELREATARLERIEQAGRDGDVEQVVGEVDEWLHAWHDLRVVVQNYVESLRGVAE